MLRRALPLVLAIASLAACASRSSTLPVLAPTVVTPFINQTGGQNGWAIFPFPQGVYLDSMVAGHDGHMWMITSNGPVFYLSRIDMDGNEIQVPLKGNPIGFMTPNPDGNMYVAEQMPDSSYAIAQVTPQGSSTDFPVPIPSTDSFTSIESGSDGNIWTASFSGQYPIFTTSIGRMTTGGLFTAMGTVSGVFRDLARGPDLNIWSYGFSDSANLGGFLRVAIADGTTTFYPEPFGSTTLGSDNAFWQFYKHTMYRFDPLTGIETSYPASGFDGNIVALSQYIYWDHDQNIFRWNVKTLRSAGRMIAPFPIGGQLFAGPDRQLWDWVFPNGIHGGASLGVLLVHEIVPTPTSITISSGQSSPLTVVEKGSPQHSFTAVSSNPGVATVLGSGETFTVTGVSSGTATVTLSDKIGNSLDVPVTVQ